ncbi:MAG: NAD(P)-dependent oxidoreductase [Verrucomicrobiota bacterium]
MRAEGKQVAVLGLGIIGSRCLARLRDAGWLATGWNRTPKQIDGVSVSPTAAVQNADIVSLYLKDAEAVRETMEEVFPALRSGAVVLNHSTVDPATTCWLAARCAERGFGFLDAPFTGSKVAAAAGQLVYYVAGDSALAGELDDFLAVTGRKRLPCGGVGNATVVKLATNLISASMVQAMAESLAIATSHGVPADVLVAAVAENVSSSVLSTMKFPAMLTGDYETHFSLANMAKDCRYMVAMSKEAGLETPGIAAVSKRMETLCADGFGDFDYSVLAKPYLEKP